MGGTLTNWGTIQKRIARLKEIKRMEEDGTFEVLPKKEVALLNKQRARLEKFLGGIEDMPRIPDVMYVVDPHKEQIAVKEAKKLGIPVVAMVDTNTDPDDICRHHATSSASPPPRLSAGPATATAPFQA